MGSVPVGRAFVHLEYEMNSGQTRVKAAMPQRYLGQQYGSGDEFEMSTADAADAVAVRMVSVVKSTVAAPPLTRAAVFSNTTRAMEPTKAAERPTDDPEDDPVASQATAGGRSTAPQRPYPHRAMNARR